MPTFSRRRSDPPKNKSIIAAITCLFLIAAIWVVYKHVKKKFPEEELIVNAQNTTGEVSQKQPINYNNLSEDEELKDLMKDRKAKYNVNEGIDMIVKSDESLKIGENTVEMKDIIEKANLQNGKLVENDILGNIKSSPDSSEDYGIYIVQKQDNIWNIHFKLLMNYFSNKGVTLSPRADEPQYGRSTGVGKLLKFSEKMVYIYNLNDKVIDSDIHSIQPLSKIIVYNMKEIFELLEEIDYEEINRIQFDGETIWLPAEQ